MATWTLEPGHTAAEFAVRHMMVTWVRGAFKNVHGEIEFDPEKPTRGSVEIEIDAAGLWSGDDPRDDHLKSADFLDVEKHPKITYRGEIDSVIGENAFRVRGDLTLRGVTKPTVLDIDYLGQWATPWWEDGEDKGPKIRAGFQAKGEINRQDFGISWQGDLERGGVVVGDHVFLTIDVEAIRED